LPAARVGRTSGPVRAHRQHVRRNVGDDQAMASGLRVVRLLG
jgi:hypothetical protein